MDAIKRLIDVTVKESWTPEMEELGNQAAAELESLRAVVEAAKPFSVKPDDGITVITLDVKFIDELAAALERVQKTETA